MAHGPAIARRISTIGAIAAGAGGLAGAGALAEIRCYLGV